MFTIELGLISNKDDTNKSPQNSLSNYFIYFEKTTEPNLPDPKL